MTPEFAAKVFEAFERERTSTVSGIQGTGLGMAITKSIIDKMGGEIEVSSAPGMGTEFIVRLRHELLPDDKNVGEDIYVGGGCSSSCFSSHSSPFLLQCTPDFYGFGHLNRVFIAPISKPYTI